MTMIMIKSDGDPMGSRWGDARIVVAPGQVLSCCLTHLAGQARQVRHVHYITFRVYTVMQNPKVGVPSRSGQLYCHLLDIHCPEIYHPFLIPC